MIRDQAMRLLSTREHGFSELQRKLNKKYNRHDEVLAVIKQLQVEDWQSDDRFTEAYVRSRQQRGFGPVRIRQELRQRSIGDERISSHLRANDVQWDERARQAREKKYGELVPKSYSEKMKQSRFLQYLGFTNEQIKQAFGTVED